MPSASERISYNIPTYRLERDVIHVGAFKTHIGLYPPVRDPKLQARLRRYQGPKGNLQFPLDEPLPYGLIAAIAFGVLGNRAKRRGEAVSTGAGAV